MRLRLLVPVFALAACGKKESPPATVAPTATPPATTAPATTPTATPPATTAPATTAPAPTATTAPATTAPATTAPGVEDAGAAPPQAGACAAGTPLTLDLAAFEAKAKALHEAYEAGAWRVEPKGPDDRPGVDRTKAPKPEELFKALGLDEAAKGVALTADESAGDVFDCKVDKQALSLEVGATDTLLTLACSNESRDFMGDGDVVYAGVALRPRGDAPDQLCRLGAIVREMTKYETPCLGFEGEAQWQLTPVELVAAGRHALREDVRGGRCGDGTMRGNDVRLTFWGLEAGKLTELFSGAIDETWYESPCPPTMGIVGAVTLQGDFPKSVSFARERVCEAALEDCPAPEEPCTPQKGTELWIYQGGAYVLQGPPALSEATAAAEPTNAAGFMKRARLAMRDGQTTAAIADYRKAMELDAELPKLRGELGWALFVDGQLAEARVLTEAALAKADKPASKGALLYNLGRIDEAEGHRDAAIERYRASLAARKNDTVQKRLDALTKAK